METEKNGTPLSSFLTAKECRGPPSKVYKVITPRSTLFFMKNFKNAVNLHPKEKLPCKNTWYRDLRSTHTRNKRLLDLPFPRPKCCADIYNKSLDQQKLKKLKKYSLKRPVRTVQHGLEPETLKVCEPGPVTVDIDLPEPHIVFFPECYILPESDPESDSEDNMMYEYCKSGSISECSMCSNTVECGTRRKIHRVMKSHCRDLLDSKEAQYCRDKVKEEIRKQKLGRDFKLKLKKVF